MIINFIRHAKTAGNLKKAYIGATDESLCEEGIKELSEHIYPKCNILISSPMKRCIETSKIIYPDMTPEIYDELRECNFGRFEGFNYKELSGDSYYQAWIDSGGTMTFPEGENPEEFKKRCIEIFENIIEMTDENAVVSMIVHGGTIMSVFEKYALERKSYYGWNVENASGYITVFENHKIIVKDRI